MSAVIKSGAGDRVRGLSVVPLTPEPSEDARRIRALEARLETALAEARALSEEVERVEAVVTAARAEGRAEGVAAGRREADDRAHELLGAVSKASQEAVTAFRDQLTALGDLSGGLAAAALERIVGEANGRQDLILETARRAVSQTFAGSVVRVEVSGADFQDQNALASALGAGCEALIRDDLPSGACRLSLRMGEADLDLDGQTARLRAVLLEGKAE